MDIIIIIIIFIITTRSKFHQQMNWPLKKVGEK